ncbi:MAG: hypothetical protein ACHQF2_11445, partial [Flavobacteriales bacterium]
NYFPIPCLRWIALTPSLTRILSALRFSLLTFHFSFFFFLSSFPVSSQTSNEAYSTGWAMEKDLALFIGHNCWAHYYAELGIGVHKWGGDGHHPFGSGWSVSNEMRVHKNFLMAPKLSAWIGGGAAGMAMKMNLLYYTNFDVARVAVRPEIGLGGFGYFTFVYGFNFYMGKNKIPGLNRSVVSLIIPIKLKTFSREGYHAMG